MKRKFLLIPLSFFLWACSSVQESPDRTVNGCVLPPEGFSKKDLIGTWHAGGSDNSDTLIIKEDGTYKQILHIEYTTEPPFDYESDWQPWSLEYGENGLPYLHMVGMRLCAYVGGYIDCKVIGGGDAEKNKWYDFCKKTWVRMPGEGVLIVQGWPRLSIKTPQPKYVALFLLQRSANDVWAYSLRKTPAPTLIATMTPNGK